MFKRWRIRKYRKQVEAQMIELLYDIDSNAGVMAKSSCFIAMRRIPTQRLENNRIIDFIPQFFGYCGSNPFSAQRLANV